MKCIRVALWAALACAYSTLADAISLNQNPDFAFGRSAAASSAHSLVLPHTTPLELEPIPLSSASAGTKLAAVKSLVGLNKTNDFGIDSVQLCLEQGYTLTSCPSGQVPNNTCSEDGAYFKSCVCDTSAYPILATDHYDHAKECGNLATISVCSDNNGDHLSCDCSSTGVPMGTCNGSNQYLSVTGTISKPYLWCKDNLGRITYPESSCQTCSSPQIINDTKDGCTCPSTWFECGLVDPMADPVGPECINEYGLVYHESCRCPSSFYPECNTDNNEIGDIECRINGQSFYQDCICPYDWTTCDRGGGAGAKKCTKNGIDYWSSCKQAPQEVLIDCAVGSVVYEDLKCYEIGTTEKTPIAVVFDTEKKLAAALEDLPSYLEFGGYGTDIPSLDNCTDTSAVKTTCGIDGKANTTAIIAYGKSNSISYPAAEYCHKYATAGTNAGDWFLPSAAEMNTLYWVKNAVNESLLLIGKSEIQTNYDYCSSTEYSASHLMGLDMEIGGIGGGSKKVKYNVRPVIQYETPPAIEIECMVGSVLYDDKKCYSGTPAGRTPIAVVFNTTKKLAAALEMAPNHLAFGGDGSDIPNLENCTDKNAAMTNCSTNGKANTAAIINFGKANSISYPAAEYCNKYTTAGTNAGDWFLPSAAEISELYEMRNAVNASLSLLGKLSMPSMYSSTSTERSATGIWNSNLIYQDVTLTEDGKSSSLFVRPIINYDVAEITCTVGSILYDNKKCYSGTPVGRTPIAVVFDTTKKLATALEDAPSNLAFDKTNTDIPNMVNCSPVNITTCETDGKTNTATIIAFGKSKGIPYPAADYCNNYTTIGTNAGEWFLPSVAELKKLAEVKNEVTTSLQNLHQPTFGVDKPYWSSTENSALYAWRVIIGNNQAYDYDKYYTAYVRPVIQYEASSSSGIDCSSIAVTVPANASCTGSSTDCPGTCTEWSCNSGYIKDGNTCKNNCTYTFSRCPVDAQCINCVNASGETKYKVVSCYGGGVFDERTQRCICYDMAGNATRCLQIAL